jgi:hypothetical protein
MVVRQQIVPTTGAELDLGSVGRFEPRPADRVGIGRVGVDRVGVDRGGRIGLGHGTSLQRPEEQALNRRHSPVVSFVDRHPLFLAPPDPRVELNRSTPAVSGGKIHKL